VPLSDGVVALRLTAERDIPEVLIAYQDDPELHLRLGTDWPPSGAELGRRAELSEARLAAGDSVTLAITQPGQDLCIGEVHVHGVDWDNRRAELGVWVVAEQRGKRLAGRALRLVSSWLLDECRLERVGLRTESGNQAMIRAAQAAGFRPEGVLRGYTLEQGRRVDNLTLSLVASDLAG
jgi:RimJ/RimL family protein N-acetyltransferase